MNERDIGRLALLPLAAILLLLPALASDYLLLLANRVLIYGLIVMSVSLLAGQLGLVSLAQTTFAGLAGYAVAILSVSHGLPFPWPPLLALVLVVAVGALFALLTARLEGVPFMMLTLALGQMFWALSYQWSDLTRGANGFTGIPTPAGLGIDLSNRAHLYYLALATCVLGFLAALRLVNSRYGLLLRGIRDNKARMKAFGHPVARARFVFFLFCAVMAGAGGMLLTWQSTVITPTSLDLNRAIWVLTAAVLGGISSVPGALVGTVIVVALEATLNQITSRHLVVFGAVLIFSVIAMPQGLVPWLEARWRARFGAGSRKEAGPTTDATATPAPGKAGP